MNRFTDNEEITLKKIKERTLKICKKCGGSGWQKDDNTEDGIKECECRQVFRYLKELVYARIPREYWGLDIGTIEVDKIVKLEVTRYLKNFSNAVEAGLGFCFLGLNGVGKTTLLAEIGKVAVLKGLSTLYIVAQEYINYKYVSDSNSISRIEEGTDVLLLDELEKPYQKKESDYVQVMTENLLRVLLPKNKVVCICTNWSKDELKKYFGDSVYSIMLRKLKFITVKGEDKSKDLQGHWEERLIKGNINFLNPYFVNISKKMRV
jgi:DNA replication protein DnaC